MYRGFSLHTSSIAEKPSCGFRGKHEDPVILATSSRRSVDAISNAYSRIRNSQHFAYREASSAIVRNIDVVPIQTIMNPYTRPAGPPLNKVSYLARRSELDS